MVSLVPEVDVIEIAKSAMRILEEIAEHVDMASAIELMLRHDTLGGLTFTRKVGRPTEAVTRLNQAIDGFAQDHQKCRPVCEAFRQAIITDGWKILEDMAFGDAYLKWMDLPMQQDLFMEHGLQAIYRGVGEMAGQNILLHNFLILYWRWFLATQPVLRNTLFYTPPTAQWQVDRSASQSPKSVG